MYEPKSEPFSHQDKIFQETKDLKAWGLLWEQGCGKTKPVIDTTAYLFEKNAVDGLIVVAPNGVHINWLLDEFPRHMPDRVMKKTMTFVYKSGKMKRAVHREAADRLMRHDGLSVLLISYDGFMTKEGKLLVWRFLNRRRCLYASDETHNIKEPGAKRTRSVVASARYAEYRRIMTGTPVAEGPFDIYSQLKFLDEDIWKRRGMSSFRAFKHHFGVWRTREEIEKATGFDPKRDILVEYKNMDELHDIIKSYTSRVVKADVLDLPEKLYSKRYFDLSDEQAALYSKLKKELYLELSDGRAIDASLAIVRLLRLQQITSGYLQSSSEEPIEKIPGPDRRLDTLLEILEPLGHKAIVWARFRHEIDKITDALGKKAVRYDGRVSDKEAQAAKVAFQEGEAQFFVSNPARGGTGLTLTAASTVVYYSNSFKLTERLQSEDRAHRIGQKNNVHYVDIVANGTVDMHIVRALREKLEISSVLTGDKLKEWI